MKFYQTSITWSDEGERINALLNILCDELDERSSSNYDTNFDRFIISIVSVDDNPKKNDVAARGLEGKLITKLPSGIICSDFGFAYKIGTTELSSKTSAQILNDVVKYISDLVKQTSKKFGPNFRSDVFVNDLESASLAAERRLDN